MNHVYTSWVNRFIMAWIWFMFYQTGMTRSDDEKQYFHIEIVSLLVWSWSDAGDRPTFFNQTKQPQSARRLKSTVLSSSRSEATVWPHADHCHHLPLTHTDPLTSSVDLAAPLSINFFHNMSYCKTFRLLFFSFCTGRVDSDAVETFSVDIKTSSQF